MRPIYDQLMKQAAMMPGRSTAQPNIKSSHCQGRLGGMPWSRFLREQAQQLRGEVSLGWLTAQAGSVLPGLLLALTALPSLLPVPGIGNLTGGALFLMAWGIWRGQTRLQLPARLAALQLPAPQAARLLRLLAWVYDFASLHLRRRALRWVGRSGWVWSACPVAAMALVIFLPIPLGNVFGTLSLVALGLGHALEDGLAVLAAWALSALTLAYTALLPWGLLVFGERLWGAWVSGGG